MLRILAAIALLCLVSFTAEAKQSPYPSVTQFNGDRYAGQHVDFRDQQVGRKNRYASKIQRHSRKTRGRHWDAPMPKRPIAEPGSVAPLSVAGGAWREAARIIGGRPAGCPSRFCGCGASLHLFGRIIPSLNLAANWLRFPRAAPAPKMVAARRGHVFVLERHIAGNTWLVFDANSGGRRTRIHPRSIAGYVIVNPRGA